MRRLLSVSVLALALTSPVVAAEPPAYPASEALVLDLAKQSIAIRSVRGEGNKTIDVAKLFKATLVAGGWADSDVEVTPLDDTAYLIATWPGRNKALKPVVISCHMDVVEAKPADWERDPFTPIVENGYLYGRGASDTKFECSLAIGSMIELRKQGYKPERSIVIAYSGDEETTMATSKVLANRFANAELVLNVDSSSGTLSEETGKPSYWSWQGAEKSYVDYRLEVTNPGGHSSAPRADNAIAQLSQALVRIGAYRFKPELNDITRAYFIAAAPLEGNPKIAAAMKAFAANPADEAAIAVLRADPAQIGRIGTTCVPTMVNGGHAENALPQRATAVVNCRVFPGHSRAEIMAELKRVADVPQVVFTDVTGDTSIEGPASPMRPDYVKAAERAVKAAWGNVPIIPTQSSGASDSMWYRAKGVPSYGSSASMTKESDDFSHGLNERIGLLNIRPGITFYMSLLRDLTSK